MKYLIGLVLLLTGCTDADRGYLMSYGDEALIECYSGGVKVFTTTTTGKVGALTGGGWAFRTKNNLYVQTFADCFVIIKE